MNALTVAMGDQFVQAVEEMVHAANDGKIRSCIVTGDGTLCIVLYCSLLYCTVYSTILYVFPVHIQYLSILYYTYQ